MPPTTGDTDYPESLVAEFLVRGSDRHAEALDVIAATEDAILGHN